jgi:hypothetical protein
MEKNLPNKLPSQLSPEEDNIQSLFKNTCLSLYPFPWMWYEENVTTTETKAIKGE